MLQNEQQNQTPVLTKAMEAAGISMKPKMSDIVEMVVTEKIKEFRVELARLNGNASSLLIEITQINKENFIKAFRNIPYFKNLVNFSDKNKWKIEAISSYRSDFSCDSVKHISSENNANTIKINKLNRSESLLSGTGKIIVFIKTELGEFKGDFVAEILDSKEMKDLHKRILAHNEEVEKFYENWNNLSFSQMKAAIKSEFQRKSVQALPGEVTKLLEETFNINL